jgi:FKBP-type peptidyl-prolyl cis-trans isomerase SlyD
MYRVRYAKRYHPAMAMTIAADTVVSIHYTLKLDNGEVVDTSSGGEPLAYLHGHGNIVPGLESELTGRNVGDEFAVKVSPEEGYGPRDPRGVQVVPRGNFPDEIEIQPGMQFQAQTEDGHQIPLTVAGVEGDKVTVDMNHPLAGQNLHFQIEVTAVRKATDEELEHGHVHGPGGHNH